MNEELQGEHDQESGRGDDARAAQAIKPPTDSGERRLVSDRRLLNTVALLAVLVFSVPLAAVALEYLITAVVSSPTEEQTAQQQVEQMIVGEWEIERLIKVLRPGLDRFGDHSEAERQEAVRKLGAIGQPAVRPLQAAIQQHERYARKAELHIKYIAAIGAPEKADYYIEYIVVVRSDLAEALRLAENR